MSAIAAPIAERVAAQTDVKQSATRLLDLIHGWKNYVVSENGAYPDTLTGAELADLYQEAGGVAARDYPDLESEQNAVCRFIIDRSCRRCCNPD